MYERFKWFLGGLGRFLEVLAGLRMVLRKIEEVLERLQKIWKVLCGFKKDLKGN